MGSNLVTNWTLSGAVMGGLFLFGIAYAMFVHNLGSRKDGYTWLLVVVGNMATLVGGAIINATALDMFVLFACSGSPMALGSIYEHIIRREAYQRERERALSRVIGEITEDD